VHPAVVAAEYGRCIKKGTVASSGYSDAGCTKAVTSDAHYEWAPGPGPKYRFTTKSKAGSTATLETVKGTKVTCTGEASQGQYRSVTTVSDVVVTFTGCSQGEAKCRTEGHSEGTIVTAPLEGELGLERVGHTPAEDKVGLALSPTAGSASLASFRCGAVQAIVTGSVLHPVSADKMLLTTSEAFTQAAGHQSPEAFVECGREVLDASFAGSEAEQAGEALATTATNEEKVEIRTVDDGGVQGCAQ
jgi:hypothetical protein